jgi:hypothetical protein
MNYFVKRGTEELGPYSLADLQQAVSSGKINPGDLARSEGMNDWAMVSQVVGNIPVPVTSYGAAAAPAVELPRVPLMANLHWALVLILGVVTRQLFNLVWAMIQANWARKLDGNNNTLILVAMYPAGNIAGLIAIIASAGPGSEPGAGVGLGFLLIFGGLVAYIIGIFKIKAAMEAYYNFNENIGLRLSGVMTFFFSTVYLQYHVNQIAKRKKEGTMNLSYR